MATIHSGRITFEYEVTEGVTDISFLDIATFLAAQAFDVGLLPVDATVAPAVLTNVTYKATEV